MSSEGTPNTETGSQLIQEPLPSQQQQQQGQQQQTQSTQTQQQGQAKTGSTRLVDMEAELKEMESLITPETPIQSLPIEFRRSYLSKIDQIENKKQEIKSHFNSLIDDNYLKKDEADFYMKNISSPDLATKKPVFGYIEASVEANLRNKIINDQKMRELRESNKRLIDDRDRISQELESVKKRARIASYDNVDQNVPVRHQFDTDNNKVPSKPLYQKEVISLLRYNDRDISSDVRRETVTKAHELAMFDNQLEYACAVNAGGENAYEKLWQNITKWNS